jgi:tetratricopeptide (TPR) repeat protein
MLLVEIVVRLAYVAAQSRTDPWFVHPSGDPADNLMWAWELVTGEGLRGGVYYGPPLYAYLLSGFLRLFGQNYGLLYYLQHLSMVAAAGLLALAARRWMGSVAGIAAAALFLRYHPNLFFPSRPVVEPIAILLLALALFALSGRARWCAAVCGLVAGTASVAKPSLLVVAPTWALGEWRRSSWRVALALMGAMMLALVPTTIRNYAVSGHIVPVSSNAGITFYHGNGPGATGYIRVPPELAQGGKADQRQIATWLAGKRSGLPLDDVEADRWWGRQALRERWRRPGETARLLLWRAALLSWSAELALDMGPRQDLNPLRWASPLPFAVILGLAAAGITLVGWRGTGGWPVWGAVAACAITPLAFYVASRYRLPMVAMLCLPAGAGLAALFRPRAEIRSRWIGLVVVGVVIAGSLLVPAGDLLAQSDAGGISQRAWAWRQVGGRQEAEADLRRSLELLDTSAPAWVQLGDLLELTGRRGEAEKSYRRALELHPGYAPAACALGQLLRIEGRDAEAVPVLRQGLKSHAFLGVCWNHLVGALTALGEVEQAAREVQRATRRAVELDARVLEELLRRARAGDHPGGAAPSGTPPTSGEE